MPVESKKEVIPTKISNLEKTKVRPTFVNR